MITFYKIANSLDDANEILSKELGQQILLDSVPDHGRGKFRHDFRVVNGERVLTILNVIPIANIPSLNTEASTDEVVPQRLYISILFNMSLSALEKFDDFKEFIKNGWLIEDMEIYNFDVYEKLAGYINSIRESVGLDPIHS